MYIFLNIIKFYLTMYIHNKHDQFYENLEFFFTEIIMLINDDNDDDYDASDNMISRISDHISRMEENF
jgi:hypothetical protein